MESALEAYVAKQKAEAEKGLLYRLIRDGDLSAEKAARQLASPGGNCCRICRLQMLLTRLHPQMPLSCSDGNPISAHMKCK